MTPMSYDSLLCSVGCGVRDQRSWLCEIHGELRPVTIVFPPDCQSLAGGSLYMRLACKSGMGIAEENEIKKLSYHGVRESVLAVLEKL